MTRSNRISDIQAILVSAFTDINTQGKSKTKVMQNLAWGSKQGALWKMCKWTIPNKNTRVMA